MKKSELRKIIREEIKNILLEQSTELDRYWEDIFIELKRLNSGEKLLKQLNKKYKKYIEINFKKKIDSKKTAQFIRDRWYGV